MLRTNSLLAIPVLAALLVPAKADDFQPPMGGAGGVPFNLACPDRTYLAGMWVHVGDDVDRLTGVCAGLAPDGSRGAFTELPAVGGPGGGEGQPLICPTSHPFVKAIAVSWEGRETVILNSVSLTCLPMHPDSRQAAVSISVAGPQDRNDPGFLDDLAGFVSDVVSVVEDAATVMYLGAYGATYSFVVYGEPIPHFSDEHGGGRPPSPTEGWNQGMSAASCTEGHTVSGMTGRAGKWVDAVGVV